MTDFQVSVTGDKELDRFFKGLTGTLQRGALRKGVRAAGSALVKEIRANIGRMVGRDSASNSRTRTRLSTATGRKTSLKKSITQRAYTRRNIGLIGTVVGPSWRDGAHGHLVEFGHDIWSHGVNTGRRTRPIPFQRRAMRSAKPAVIAAQRKKLQDALKTLKAK